MLASVRVAGMRMVRDFVVAHLADPDAVVVFDQTGQEKKGSAAVGVARQCIGTVGKVTTCVNAVYASYATASPHHFLLVRRSLAPADLAFSSCYVPPAGHRPCTPWPLSQACAGPSRRTFSRKLK